MYALKIIVSTLDVIMMLIMLWFCYGTENSRANIIGFLGMIGLYALNMLCMWR